MLTSHSSRKHGTLEKPVQAEEGNDHGENQHLAATLDLKKGFRLFGQDGTGVLEIRVIEPIARIGKLSGDKRLGHIGIKADFDHPCIWLLNDPGVAQQFVMRVRCRGKT